MKVGNRYLLIKKEDKNSSIEEWECLEIGKTSTKFKIITKNDNNLWSFSYKSKVDDEFWLLNTKFDTIGEAEYKIIEELEPVNKIQSN